MSIGPNLSQTPINVLQQAVLGQIPSIQPASALGELNSRVKNAQMQQAALGQNAMQQSAMQQQQPPVAAGVLQASQGIDHPGYGFAGGGIVAFAGGGPTLGYAPDYELARKYGIVLSPYDPPEVRQQKIAEAKKLAAFEAEPKAEIPNEFAIRNMVAGYTDPNRARLDIPAAPGGIAQVAPGAQGGPRPQVAPRPQAAPAQDDFLKRLQALSGQEEELAKLAGAVTPEIQKAREEYGAARTAGSEMRKAIEQRQQEALNQRRAEAEKQAAVSPLDNPALLAALAGGAQGKTLGAVLSGAAGAGGAEYTRQKKELRDIQDRVRAEQLGVDTLTIARMDYDAATKQAALADASGDRAQKLAAETKLLEARRHLMDTESKYTHGKEQLATQIKVAQIGAAAKSSAMDLAERKLALSSMKADPDYAAVSKNLADATKQHSQLNSDISAKRLRDAQAAALALAKKHGATPADIVGVLSETPGASPGAAGQGKVYDWNQISAPKS